MGKICDFRKTFHCVKTQIRQKKKKTTQKNTNCATSISPLRHPQKTTPKDVSQKEIVPELLESVFFGGLVSAYLCECPFLKGELLRCSGCTSMQNCDEKREGSACTVLNNLLQLKRQHSCTASRADCGVHGAP